MSNNIKDDKFWFVRTSKEVLDELKSSRKGLTDSECKRRQEEFGLNALESTSNFTVLNSLWKNFNTLLIYILIVAAVVSLLASEYIEMVVILIIVFLTVILSFFQEYKADQSVKALSKLTAKKVRVLRDGEKKLILAENLVPGDIVFLSRGDIVAADLRILESSSLLINEAVLTGESKSRAKFEDQLERQDISIADQSNMAFSGTSVTGGSGIGVVVEIGINSQIGKISETLKSIEVTSSPLQKKIHIMSKNISYIVLTIALILFLILMVQGNPLTAVLILIAAVIVAGIPECFPLALTLSLSNGIRKMAKQNAVVKGMSSVETLGTTTVICTDKTGTLTENKMRVTKIYFSSDDEFEVSGQGYEPMNIFKNKESLKVDSKVLRQRQEFFECCVLCNDSELVHQKNEWKIIGEPTEGSLLTLARSLNYDDVVLRENYKKVFEVPFDPSKKFMISVHKKKNDFHAYLKGAAEKVLDKCTHYRGKNGDLHDLSSSKKKHFINEMDYYSSQGLRVLFLASKHLKGMNNVKRKEDFESHLKSAFIFEGFVGIEDPIRLDVYKAVSDCKSSGVKVVVITGDYKITAKHIGEKLGIIESKGKHILEGSEIDLLSDLELDDIINDITIFSRATPEHKLRIVSSLQRKGEIVAMTGDGVNDAPALKKADIGVSMGRSGTEVAREASDMVLTDDNFSTIVKAIGQGRTIYSNIRRFIFYLLTINLTLVSLMFLSVLFNIPLPLSALMILFINIIASTIPAMALSIEPTHDKVMKQKPRNPKEKLLSPYIITKILVVSPFIIAGTFGFYLWKLLIEKVSYDLAMSFAFLTVIIFVLFHTFNARRLHSSIFDKGFFENKSIFTAICISIVLTLLVFYTNLGQEIFGVVPLSILDWIQVIVVSSTVLLFSEIIKLSIKAEFEEQKNLGRISTSRLN